MSGALYHINSNHFIMENQNKHDEQPQEIRIPVSKLKLLPIDQRMRLIGLIEANIGKRAKITLDHTDPKHIFVELHPEHVRMVKVGWLQNVDMDTERKELMGK